MLTEGKDGGLARVATSAALPFSGRVTIARARVGADCADRGAVMWRMDRDRLLMMLDGFYIPNTNGVSIASVVDREPIGIIGNSLVYRVGAASFLKVTTPADLYNVYAESEPISDPGSALAE